jgi:multidrug efflux pump subunit AcrA (membrane-fusion protein)
VTKIASTATSRGSSTGKTFKVEILMASDEVEFRAGITAKAEIQVEEIPDVLQVPIHAVIAEGEEHFCYVSNHEGPQKRIVKVGKNNAHFVEVTEGLEEGEQVLLYDPREGGQFVDEEGEAKEENGAPVSAGANGIESLEPNP